MCAQCELLIRLQARTKMNTRKLLVIVSICAIAACLSGSAMARGYGLADSHHVWRSATYWHTNYPQWVYRYHPEWVVDEPGWWEVDHMYHPGWFYWPFWEEYPIWEYGIYDRSGVWHYAWWWRERYPDWMYRYHPEWAAAHADWLRSDHERHPAWFRSDYWREHPRDWNHPDAFYRPYAIRAKDSSAGRYQLAHTSHESRDSAGNHSGYQPNAGYSPFHQTNEFHAAAPSTYHAATSASSGGGSHKK
jgi:hypothetical protein